MLIQNKFLLILSAAVLAVSCNKTKPHDPEPPLSCIPIDLEDSCDSWAASAGLVSITGPSTGTTGQEIQLTVGLTGNNGCADGAQITGNASGNVISLSGNVHYHGCICTQALTEQTGTYNFTPAQPGTYTFQGTTYDGNPVVHTVTVQ